MAPVARYTVLRILVFFGCVCLGYLCGLRSFLLLIVAALASTAISFFALNRFRQETVDVVEDRVEKRRARAQQLREAEDLEED